MRKQSIKSIYGNLTEQKGIITTKSKFIDKVGIKKLEYGFDPYRYEKEHTLFFYWWDFKDSALSLEEFKKELKLFFEKTYNKSALDIRPLYVGWQRVAKGNY